MAQDDNGRWKKLDSRIVYENPWMTVREDTVRTPNGGTSIYGWLETPIAAGVLAITENDEAILVGQHRYPVDAYTWEIVEGAVEGGENPISAAKREMREEAGIEARSIFPLGSPFHFTNSRSNEIAHLFVATGLQFGETSPDETELIAIKKVPLVDLYEMVKEGEIQDAMTIIAVQRYQSLFNP